MNMLGDSPQYSTILSSPIHFNNSVRCGHTGCSLYIKQKHQRKPVLISLLPDPSQTMLSILYKLLLRTKPKLLTVNLGEPLGDKGRFSVGQK